MSRSPRAPRSPRLGAVLLVLLTLLARATAQDAGWSIQVVALRDLREAERSVEALREAGFPAFTEFTMADGMQYVRVRVGCWSARDAALGVVPLLLAGYAREAAVVPHSDDSPRRCIAVDVGFLTPANWAALHHEGELPTFRVELAGHVGHLRHDGDRWLVLQGDATPEAMAVDTLAWHYRSGELGAGAVVFDEVGGTPRLVCPGRMIGQVGDVVIVAWEDAVVACRPPSLGDDAQP